MIWLLYIYLISVVLFWIFLCYERKTLSVKKITQYYKFNLLWVFWPVINTILILLCLGAMIFLKEKF